MAVVGPHMYDSSVIHVLSLHQLKPRFAALGSGARPDDGSDSLLVWVEAVAV